MIPWKRSNNMVRDSKKVGRPHVIDPRDRFKRQGERYIYIEREAEPVRRREAPYVERTHEKKGTM